jgi:hypothetical protein
MSENLKKFKNALAFVYSSAGPHEATFGLLKDLAKSDIEVLRWVIDEFQNIKDYEKKSDLARIAVATGMRAQFEIFLREEDGWTDEDFKV